MTKIKLTLACAAMALAMSGCDLFHEELPDCAVAPSVYSNVSFVCDYNTSMADRFGTDVGSVELYVCDADGALLQKVEKTNYTTGNALKQEDFKIDLSLDPGTYKVYALAYGASNGHAASLSLPGAKFRVSGLGEQQPISRLSVSLDNTDGIVYNQGVMLDTIWATRAAQTLVVPEVYEPKEGDPQQDDIYVNATIPLLRMTNHLRLTFYQYDFPNKIDPAHYEVWIKSENGRETFDILGNFHDDSSALTFSPYRTSTTTDNLGNKCVEMDFGFTRMIWADTRADRKTLCIKNLNTGNVTEVDLMTLLALGNNAYSHGWSNQEYLDREYEYDLALCLTDKTWKFATVSVNILAWSKRVQNEDL